MIRFEGVSKIYSTDVVLKNINWEIKKGEKVGLVGSNGAGKSTQFKILIGEEEQTSGTIIKEGNPKIAHLKQEFDFNLNFDLMHNEIIIVSKLDEERTRIKVFGSRVWEIKMGYENKSIWKSLRDNSIEMKMSNVIWMTALAVCFFISLCQLSIYLFNFVILLCFITKSCKIEF